jgi:hypothetical protein
VAPQPVEALSALWGEAAFRANAATAGLAANRFVLNPALGAAAANVTRNAVETRYDAMQVTVDRRLSRGLQVSANYTYSSRWTSRTDALRFEHYLVRADDAVPHAFRAMWTWALPVGDGRRFGAALPRWADALVGGWSWSGTSRVQSGTQLSLSGVRLVGMTEQELRRVFKIYVAADGTVTTLPADIILNTRRAFSVDPTNLATGYSALGAPAGRYLAPATTAGCIGLFPGTCGEARRIHVRGPQIVRFDFRFAKAFSLGGRRTAHVEVDALNVFNAIHFTPVFQAGAAAAINQVTSSYQDVARTFDPGGRLLQIGWRVRW